MSNTNALQAFVEKKKSFMQKYEILQANIIFLHKNLHIRIICSIFAG